MTFSVSIFTARRPPPDGCKEGQIRQIASCGSDVVAKMNRETERHVPKIAKIGPKIAKIRPKIAKIGPKIVKIGPALNDMHAEPWSDWPAQRRGPSFLCWLLALLAGRAVARGP